MKYPACPICNNNSDFHWDSNHVFSRYLKDNSDIITGGLLKIIKSDMEISIYSNYEKKYYSIRIFDIKNKLLLSNRINGILQLDKQKEKIEFLFENSIFI